MEGVWICRDFLAHIFLSSYCCESHLHALAVKSARATRIGGRGWSQYRKCQDCESFCYGNSFPSVVPHWIFYFSEQAIYKGPKICNSVLITFSWIKWMKVCCKLIWNMLLLLHNVDVLPDIQGCLEIEYQISVIFRIWFQYLSSIQVVSFEQTAVEILKFCLRGLFPANRFLFTSLILKWCVHSSVFVIFSWTGVDLIFKNIQDKIFLAFPNNQLFETSSYRPSLACLKNCVLSESYFSCGLLNLLVARAVRQPLHPPSPTLHWRVSNLSNFTFKITILNLQLLLSAQCRLSLTLWKCWGRANTRQ